MDHFTNLPVEYQIAAWFFVGIAAICFGIALAKTLNPTNDDMIRRGDCPACKSRKSLRVTPFDRSSAIFTCSVCVAQWLIENTDGEQIIFGPANQPVMPSLRMTYHPSLGNVVFETDVGMAIFSLEKFDARHLWGLQAGGTPRHKLSYLYRQGIIPDRLDLAPRQAELAKQMGVTSYNWFAASAGLDIYYLMPGRTPELHGTTEIRRGD